MGNPNAIAYLVLFLWPLFAWQLWRRMDPGRALAWTILGGYLFMPPAATLDLPAMPDFNKVSIPNIVSLAFAAFILRDRISYLPTSLVGRALMLLFVLSPFATVITNTDSIPNAAGDVPGMKVYDSVAAVANQAIYLIPFFMARRYLAGPDASAVLLRVMVIAGLIYSFPMLLETRLSPQVNVWVYGFFQHDFSQMMRGGGFRPIVFLPHGLWAAFFAFMCVIAALVFLRQGPGQDRPRQAMIALYLLMVLVLCKSAGPMIYFFAVAPLVLFASARTQVLIAALFALLVVTYPMLRGLQVIPVERVTELAYSINPERGHSFAFRVMNEEILLERANERPWLGWGGYGRNLILDPISGEIMTVADGAWIIVMGTYGWLGYIAEFGLLVLPLLLLGREAMARGSARLLTLPTAGLALILGANMLDLLPNATQIPFTWLMAGALLGQAEALAARRLSSKQASPGKRQDTGETRRTLI